MPRLLLFASPLNVTMILSTPTQGGHYLADVFAGLLPSALTIAALKRCMHLRRAKPRMRRARGPCRCERHELDARKRPRGLT
ncbi:hypothetical protein F6X39_34935 [Paraburkholderia sp. UCT2]|nr:hypothetical protein [Paraburkholderia sp. UCT2]